MNSKAKKHYFAEFCMKHVLCWKFLGKTAIILIMNRTRKICIEHKTATRQKLLEGIHLQEIEGNPLSAEEIAMFEMFEQQGMSDEECRKYILSRLNVPALHADE